MRNIAAVIIPGRLDSTRLPRKLLREFDGKPLIQHAYEGAMKSRRAFCVAMSLQDQELIDECKKFSKYPQLIEKTEGYFCSGTERAAHCSRMPLLSKADIICVVQADELLVDPDLIDSLIDEVSSFECDVATAVIKRKKDEGGKDRHTVKAYFEDDHLVSLDREDRDEDFFEHIGIYAYRKTALWKIASSEPSKNERLHNVELNRALDLGIKVKVIQTDKEVLNVNTEEDTVKAVKYFESKNKPAPVVDTEPKCATKPKPRKGKAKTKTTRKTSPSTKS